MNERRSNKAMLAVALMPALWSGAASGAPQEEGQSELVPLGIELGEPARRAIEADWLTDEERRDLRIFHGVWQDNDLDTPARRAAAAILQWRFDDQSLDDAEAPAELRAEAMVRAGELQLALAALENSETMAASRLRAEAREMLGDLVAADRAIDEPVELLLTRRLDDAAALTEGVRALVVRSRIHGQPARDYQTMLNLLGRARNEYDRLYWPAILTEATLLLDKDNIGEAIGALHEVLALNPRCSEAWYLLGRIGISQFNFEAGRAAAAVLRTLNEEHPLAALLHAESALIESDPDLALEILAGVLVRFPHMRAALEWRCAALALTYDEEALDQALAEYDALSPNSAAAHYCAGRLLAFDRQYEAAAELLNEAVRRQPNWPAPRIELALLELQSGRDALALAAMREVRELDQFNKRIANSIFLLEELMMNFKQIETEHFIIRYSPTSGDQVVADLMPERLEVIHRIVSGRFEHEPSQKTVIELMPDHQWFAVRISGMPQIHTIAACTGPVIAMEVPREGPPQKHFGTYYWPQVIQHEYAHTITLSQTRNRIPHWLTEAAAVSIEGTPRDLDRVMMLVDAWRNDRLFTLDEINWAFIRPKRAGDRGLAYAQGHWMVEFMNERFGESALIQLIERYFEGEQEEEAIPRALGVSREEFFDAFLVWADEEIREWGYAPEPSMESLEDELRAVDPDAQEKMRANRQARLDFVARSIMERIGRPAPDNESAEDFEWPELQKPDVEIDDEQLVSLLDRFPDHPDLLFIAAMRSLQRLGEPTIEIVALLEKYAAARPADPTPHKTLALFWQQSDTPERAIRHLEELDSRTVYEAVYAVALAGLYREQRQFDLAYAKILKAVNTNPYDAPNRELAAAIAVQAGDLAAARLHVAALTIIEPDRPQHQRRLEAIDRMIAENAE